jgi:hypothetical protein
MTTYFLSYARLDERTALRFADDLIVAGVSVWVDQYDIQPAQHWDRAVETAVRGCRGLIVILSPRSAASPNVADEIGVAMNEGKEIIPILIEPCTVPLRMTRMQYIDATQDYADAVRRCLGVIRDHGAAPEPAGSEPAPEPSRLPLQVLRDAERHLTGFMGPISPLLVRQAAVRATSRYELYEDLARNITNATDQKSFLDWMSEDPSGPGRVVTASGAVAPVPPQNPLSSEDIEAITSALIRHLGPIAAHLVKREAVGARSRLELCQKLAARVPAEKDRVAFLRETQGL